MRGRKLVGRLALALSLPVTAGGCAGEYEGDVYDRVTVASDVEVRETLPDGYRIIGEVADWEENVVDGSRAVSRGLGCYVDRRLTRRMKRAAARNGGELLVDLLCEHDEEEDFDPAFDDPETDRVETQLTCWTECSARVARAWSHDS